MRNAWKWAAIILGIIIVLLLVASPFLLRSGFAGMPMHGSPRGWENGMGGHPDSRMMGGFGFFNGGWILLARLFGQVVVIGLIAMGVAALFKLISAKKLSSLPATAPAAAAPAPVRAPEPAQACKACGKDLQAEWAHCPFCGEKI